MEIQNVFTEFTAAGSGGASEKRTHQNEKNDYLKKKSSMNMDVYGVGKWLAEIAAKKEKKEKKKQKKNKKKEKRKRKECAAAAAKKTTILNKKQKKTELNIYRIWSMPNSKTFTIKPIREFIERILPPSITKQGEVWLDPFVRDSVFKHRMSYTNDLNPKFEASHHLDALEFLKLFNDNSVDGVLFDPPYSPRQIKECYENIGRRVTQQDTQSSFWSKLKKEIARITTKNAKVICCGWQSGGIGKTLGFQLVEVLMVPHGGRHNDTIVTLEYKK